MGSSGVHVHHIAFRTRDLPRLLAFYQDLLGFSIMRTSPRGEWLAAGQAILMLEHAEPGEPTVPEGCMEAVIFAIDEADRPALLRKLASHGVSLEGSTPYSLYFRDPDGRRVGVSHYPTSSLPPIGE
ncbi:MAG: VOC family protein [Myxococcales bacterium]|nr:VOC family protein [Myxococcales bacterium]MBL9111361.1 VOC family protein [Myxococcales bacterium]